MRYITLVTFALFCSTLSADARLGETYDQIEQRLGVNLLNTRKEKLYDDQVIEMEAKHVGGFDTIVFLFFRDDNNKPKTCVAISYFKFSAKKEDIEFTPQDVGTLLAKNYTNPDLDMRIKRSEGIVGDQAVAEKWSAEWEGKNGEWACARKGVDQKSRLPYFFHLQCISKEWSDYLEKRHLEEEKTRSEKRQRNLDAL